MAGEIFEVLDLGKYFSCTHTRFKLVLNARLRKVGLQQLSGNREKYTRNRLVSMSVVSLVGCFFV